MTKEEWERQEKNKKLRVAVDPKLKMSLKADNEAGLKAIDTSWTWELGGDTRPPYTKNSQNFVPHAQKF